jgi:hypothetical protein
LWSPRWWRSRSWPVSYTVWHWRYLTILQNILVKVKKCPCAFFWTEHHARKAFRGSGGIAPRILVLGTRWKWAISFKPWPLYPQGKSPWYPLDNTGIAQWYSVGLWAGWSGFRVPAAVGNFSLHRRVQTGYRNHPHSYPTVTRGSFPGDKAIEAWSWPLISIRCRGQECLELYLHSPNMPSWGDA